MPFSVSKKYAAGLMTRKDEPAPKDGLDSFHIFLWNESGRKDAGKV
jgi:hypothetical protein